MDRPKGIPMTREEVVQYESDDGEIMHLSPHATKLVRDIHDKYDYEDYSDDNGYISPKKIKKITGASRGASNALAEALSYEIEVADGIHPDETLPVDYLSDGAVKPKAPPVPPAATLPPPPKDPDAKAEAKAKVKATAAKAKAATVAKAKVAAAKAKAATAAKAKAAAKPKTPAEQAKNMEQSAGKMEKSAQKLEKDAEGLIKEASKYPKLKAEADKVAAELKKAAKLQREAAAQHEAAALTIRYQSISWKKLLEDMKNKLDEEYKKTPPTTSDLKSFWKGLYEIFDKPAQATSDPDPFDKFLELLNENENAKAMDLIKNNENFTISVKHLEALINSGDANKKAAAYEILRNKRYRKEKIIGDEADILKLIDKYWPNQRKRFNLTTPQKGKTSGDKAPKDTATPEPKPEKALPEDQQKEIKSIYKDYLKKGKYKEVIDMFFEHKDFTLSLEDLEKIISKTFYSARLYEQAVVEILFKFRERITAKNPAEIDEYIIKHFPSEDGLILESTSKKKRFYLLLKYKHFKEAEKLVKNGKISLGMQDLKKMIKMGDREKVFVHNILKKHSEKIELSPRIIKKYLEETKEAYDESKERKWHF